MMKKSHYLPFLVLALGVFAVWSVNANAGGTNVDVDAYSGSQSVSGSQSMSGSVAETGAATAGNSQSVTVTSPGTVKYDGSYTVRSTPDVTTIVPGMTAPCYVSTGVSGSGVAFGFGVATGIEDKDCTAREDARTLVSLGLKDEAVARLCQRETMAKALGAKCGLPTTQPTGPQVAYNPSTRTTTVREMNGFNH
jgi:hypothetical protein